MPLTKFCICPKCAEVIIDPKDNKKNCDFCSTRFMEVMLDQNLELAEKRAWYAANGTDTNYTGWIAKKYVYHLPEYDPALEKARQEAYQELLKQVNADYDRRKNAAKCPTCSSPNVQKIGTGEKAVSIGLFGLFSSKINKSFKCNNCGYTW